MFLSLNSFNILIVISLLIVKGHEITPHISIFSNKISKIIWAGTDQKQDCNELCKQNCLEFSLGENCFHTCGCILGNNILFLLLNNGKLYRSNDMGKLWDDEQSSLHESFERFTKLNKHLNQYKTNEDLFLLKEIIANNENPNIIWLIGKTAINWKTDNAGRSYSIWYLDKEKDLPKVSSILLHPTKNNSLLATTLSPESCELWVSEGLENCKQRLFVSFDDAKSWEILEENVKKFAWGNSGKIIHKINTRYYQHYVFGKTQKRNSDVGVSNNVVDWSTVYFSKINARKTEVMIVCNEWGIKTGRNFLNCNELLDNVHSFHFFRNYIYLAFYTADKEIKILVSHNLEKYNAIVFSDNSNPHFNFFTFFETQHGVIFLFLSEKENDFGTLYRSDYTGQRFTKMLPNLHRCHNTIDFIEVASLEGAYLANIVLFKQKGNDLEQKIQTVISYDNGNKWHHLTAPTHDHVGKQILCGYKDQCHLHLALSQHHREASSLLTTKKTIGVIFALGNLGRELSQDPDSLHPFLSVDGGITWKLIDYRPLFMSFGDLGSLLLVGSQNFDLKYSWNYGNNWTQITINNLKSQSAISNIIAHPLSNAQEFLLIGESGEGEISNGLLILLDFSELNVRQCQTPEDYEIFTPKAYEQSCILGRKISYLRKKAELQCYNGWEFEHILKQEDCECTISDYECDWGFYKVNGACEAISLRLIETNFTVECYNEHKPQYVYSKGYRKIMGDSCSGKTIFDPILLECPIYFLGLSRIQIFWLMFGIILIMTGWIVYEKWFFIKMNFISFWTDYTHNAHIHRDDIVFNDTSYNEEESSDLIFANNKESP